jgi:glycogen debranching enzyme
MKALGKQVIEKLKVHEFFMCDVRKVMTEQFLPRIQDINQGEIEKFKKIFERRGWFLRDHFELIRDKFTVGMGSGPQRNNVTLKMPDAAMFFLLANNRNREGAKKEVESLLYRLNDDWMRRAGEFMGDAYGALTGNIRYFKCELGKSHITAVNRLVEPYFSELNNAQRSKVAHNGWVGGWNCMKDFGMEGWNYLRRHINIWADNIKLRYGTCPADSPYLWSHMTKYVQDMAGVADGFRLDNTHSTPIHVC